MTIEGPSGCCCAAVFFWGARIAFAGQMGRLLQKSAGRACVPFHRLPFAVARELADKVSMALIFITDRKTGG